MKIISLLFLFITFFSYSQEIENHNNSSKKFLEFKSAIGFSTLTLEDTFKSNATIVEGVLSKEFSLSERFSIIPEIGLLKIKSDFTDAANNQSHLTNDYVILPINIRYYTNSGSNFIPFVEAGVYGSYLFKSLIELESTNNEAKENNLGGSIGLQTGIGFQQLINDNFIFRLSFITKGDIIELYKDSKPNFKINDLYALQLGFGFHI